MAEEHPRKRHPYNPSWSYGNVLSTVSIVAGGVAVFVLMQVTSARADEKIIALQKQVDEQKVIVGESLTTINKKIESLDIKVNQMGEKQAMLLANMEMLMRSQGLRPIEIKP